MIDFLKKNDNKILKKLRFKYKLIKKITLSVYVVNFIFQRIFRINANCDFQVHFTSRFINIEKMSFCYDITTLNSFASSGGCYIQANNGIKIGKNFLCASGVKIISANHDYDNLMKSKKDDPIIIGDNVWIGTGAIILPGVKLGDNCIVGAGSVVTKSFSENSIIAGNPAKLIKKRSS